jgi:hypothetical protein
LYPFNFSNLVYCILDAFSGDSHIGKAAGLNRKCKTRLMSFMKLACWGQSYKKFTAVIYGARVRVPGKPFEPSIMFAGKAHSRVSSLSYPQTLYLARKACQGQTL